MAEMTVWLICVLFYPNVICVHDGHAVVIDCLISQPAWLGLPYTSKYEYYLARGLKIQWELTMLSYLLIGPTSVLYSVSWAILSGYDITVDNQHTIHPLCMSTMVKYYSSYKPTLIELH